MHSEHELEPVEDVSKSRADKAVDWLRAVLQHRVGRQGDYGIVTVIIEVKDGQIPGSVIAKNEMHIR